ncbi:hypothetical protein ABGB17_11340 [Sphaerisporangium sp. B11E5]|uniref:hypothetical protein n=1 Tax=Sphaerisporangium sp. B11E5 TaxID=3153563 RepID=UPI00325C9915
MKIGVKNMLRAVLPAVAVAALAGGVLAGPAHAAELGGTVTVRYGVLVFTGTGVDNRILLVRSGGDLVVNEQNTGATLAAGTGCRQEPTTPGKVSCALPTNKIEIYLGGGYDEFTPMSGVTGLVDGGDQSDVYHGARPGAGTGLVYRGGPGSDRVDYVASTSRGVTVHMANRIADDGRTGLDSDNILDDVERIDGTVFDDVLIGNALNNVIYTKGGRDVVKSAEGSDLIMADTGVKDRLLDCGNGGSGPGDYVNIDSVDRPVVTRCENIS